MVVEVHRSYIQKVVVGVVNLVRQCTYIPRKKKVVASEKLVRLAIRVYIHAV